MSDNVDNLSDAEIRTRLAEYGMPVVPVTATTRKTLKKKLQLLINNKKIAASSNRMSLAKYSSGEESSGEENSKTKAEKNRRFTLGGAMLPPSSSAKKPLRSRLVPPAEVPPDDGRGVDITGRSRPSTAAPRKANVLKERPTSIYVSMHSTLSQNTSTTYSDSVSDSDEELTEPAESTYEKDSSQLLFAPSSYAARSLPKQPLSEADVAHRVVPSSTSGLNRSTASNGNQASRDYLSSENRYNQELTSHTEPVNIEGFETPFLSDFTRRLEIAKRASLGRSLKTTNRYSSSLLNDPVTHAEPLNQGSSYGLGWSTNARHMARPAPATHRVTFSNLFKKSNFIPLALVAVLITFLAVVTIMYMGIKSKPTPSWFDSENKDNVYPICKEPAIGFAEPYGQGPRPQPGVNCVEEKYLKSTLHLGNYLLPEIRNRAAAYVCKGSDPLPTTPFLMTNDVVELIHKDNPNLEVERIISDLDSLHVLVIKNPHWGLSVVQADGTVIEDLDVAARSDVYTNLGLTVLKPDLPLLCILSNRISSILSTVVILLIGGGVIYGVKFAIQYVIKVREDRKKMVYDMVESIIEVLSNEAINNGANENNSRSYVAINHIRDRLIQPHQRKAMAKIWQDAVNFLEQNESRVRSEVQTVSGEDFRVWRWVASGNHTGSPPAPSVGKVWQGQAFETQEGSVNNVPVSPTPCLKIRQMIEKNDDNPNLKTIIQDAILEKCDGCSILHIHVDQQYCCVYVKCASQRDAGLAYRSLHGWWYDGKLITAKYVRLERYLERFPTSAAAGLALRPSNNKRLSMRTRKTTDSDNETDQATHILKMDPDFAHFWMTIASLLRRVKSLPTGCESPLELTSSRQRLYRR